MRAWARIVMLRLLAILAVITLLQAGTLSAQSDDAENKEKQATAQIQPAFYTPNASDKQPDNKTNNPKTSDVTPPTNAQVKEPVQWWQKSEWWVLIVAGLTGIVVGWQSIETRNAANATQISAIAQMNAGRAWVLVSVEGQPEEPLTGNLIQKGVVPGVVWKIEIYGTTPARIIREEYRCRIIPPDPATPSKPLLEQDPVYNSQPILIEGSIVLPPGEKRHFFSILVPESGTVMTNDLAKVATGNAFFCAYGRIEYKDAFDRRGITQFCAIYHPATGVLVRSPDGILLNPSGFRIGGPPGYNFNT